MTDTLTSLSLQDRLWLLRKTIQGHKWILAASGHSLDLKLANKLTQLQKATGYKILAVNNAALLIKNPDIIYACDDRWWKNCYDGRSGLKVTFSNNIPDTVQVFGRYIDGFSLTNNFINLNGNSGFQALDILVKCGAVEINLFGYNLSYSDDGKRNCIEYENPNMRPYIDFSHALKQYEFAASQMHMIDTEIYNCTEPSKITCFPKRTLEDVYSSCYTNG